MSKPHQDVAHAVIDLLAAKVEPGPNVADAGAWRKAVRNRLRSEHWGTLMAILDPKHTNADRTAALVALLSRAPDGTPRAPEPPTVPEWHPPATPDALDPESTKARIADIRSKLGGTQ